MKVITIHGIRSRGYWQGVLDTFPELANESYELCHFDYGFFRLISFLLGFRRKAVVSNFQLFYDKNVGPGERPCAICHSFGTFIFYKAVKTYQEIRFDKVIFFGSILNPTMKLAVFFKHDQVRKLLHEFGMRDRVVRCSSFVLGAEAGKSGETGFVNIPARYVSRVKQVGYEDWGHSSASFSRHMKEAWIPFLTEPDVEYNKNILRDEVINWAYACRPNPHLLGQMSVFNARIDSDGHYYGRYYFETINGDEPIESVPVCISADSNDTLNEMSFSAYDREWRKLDHEAAEDSHHYKHIIINLDRKYLRGERFWYRYKFKLSSTIRYTGDTDTFWIRGHKTVKIALNVFHGLKKPCFFAFTDKFVRRQFDATETSESDGTFTYSLDFDNSESSYDLLVFYFDGKRNSDAGKRGLCSNQAVGSWTIRRAKASDVKLVYGVEFQIEGGNAATEQVLHERFRMFSDGFLIAQQGAQIIGYIESLIWTSKPFRSFSDICDFPIHHHLHGDCLYVIFLAVDPKSRKRGVATSLLIEIEKVAKYYAMRKIMLVAKNELEQFYHKRGFLRVKELPYFLNSEERPSVIMEKYI